MTSRSIETKPHVDSDGVRIIRASGVSGPVWLLALAMVLVGIGVFVIVRPARHGTPEPLAESAPANANVNAAGDTRLNPVEVKRVQAVPLADVPAPRAAVVDAQPPAAAEPAAATKDAPTNDGAPPATGGQNPAAAVDEDGHDEPSGLAVFPPPGTKPIKRGILVPEDFELPPGYVRHYQATDDGQRVPAILMFHPDFHPLDEHGEPIPLPADRVVPREMAPPGMPIQMLEVPESQGPKAEAPADQGPQDSPP